MRTIEYGQIANVVQRLCVESCYELPDDVLEALKTASKRETNQRAAKILNQLVENVK